MTKQEIISTIECIVAEHPQTVLRPVGFFLAWSGVITLAFEGFCSSILNIKKELETSLDELEPEQPGCRWPKTSLGALFQGVTLSVEEIEELHTLCLGWDAVLRRSARPVSVTRLDLVEYECRSLERVSSHRSLPLSDGETEESEFLPAWHLQNVDDVLAQFHIDNLKEYSKEIQKKENHDTHYRSHASGLSLVISLTREDLPFITEFKRDIDHLLPDHYAWFSEDSLHVTVRNIFS